MNLPAFALKNKTIVVVVAVLLMLLGVSVFLTAPRKEDPQFTIRDAWIITIWPGATARQVEKLVADPIEDAMAGVEAVRKIDTTSYVGNCVTQITIQDQYSDSGAVWDKVRRELTLIEPDLPPGCMSPILDDHASQAAGPRLGNELVFRKYGARVQEAVRNTGIAFDVHNSWGEYGRQIDVQLDEDKANLAGVTFSQMIYFSFVCMSSLGFGDISPPTGVAETLCWLQSVVGQFYLAILVARLVGAIPVVRQHLESRSE